MTLAQVREEVAKRGKRKHLRRCQRSFAYFLGRFVWIADGGGTKFRPWPWQIDLARGLGRFKRILTLKARQLGVSWLAAAYALWTALFQPGALVLLVSQTEDDAIELLSKVQFIYDYLPEWLKRDDAIPRTRLLKFKGIRSAVVALPSTPRAGRGRTARLVVADEHALHSWAAANYNALSPTIAAGGQFWSISTADGVGNFFADLCETASNVNGWCQPKQSRRQWRVTRQLHDWQEKVPDRGWLPLFLAYDLHPDRNAEWREQEKAAHPRPREFEQEYPRDPAEAFIQTGRPVFDKSYLDVHRKTCRAPIPREKWPAALQRFRDTELRIWELPKLGHRYCAGGDVAEGLEHGDYSDLSVIDADAPRPVEVLSLHGHWPPDVYGELIDTIARVYRGLYGIERNNHGLTTILHCQRLGTPGMYAERPVLTPQGQIAEAGKLGWLTSVVTKPVMVDDLELALRQHHIELRDELALRELTFYQTLKDGKTGAPEGQHDDRVMSRAVAVQMLKRLPAPISRDFDDDGPSGTFAARRW